MKFTINGFEVDMTESGEGFILKVGKVGPAAEPPTIMTFPPEPPPMPGETPKTGDLGILGQLGLSMKSIVQIANRVLDLNTTGPELQASFTKAKQGAMNFLTRPLKDDFTALFVSELKLPVLGETIGAVGLNKDKQLVILGFEEEASDLYEVIIKRGINPKKIAFGSLSFGIEDVKTFKKVFPNADIGLDWFEFREMTPGLAGKAAVEEAMSAGSKAQAQKLLSKLKPPPELFTHFDQDKDLWRVLKSTSSLKRIEADVTKRLRAVAPTDHSFALQWALMRLQYHWYKVPVDSEALKGLNT